MNIEQTNTLARIVRTVTPVALAKYVIELSLVKVLQPIGCIFVSMFRAVQVHRRVCYAILAQFYQRKLWQPTHHFQLSSHFLRVI